MSDIIETLLPRNLQEVFGEGDPARRRAAIEDLYTEDCVVHLPTGRHVGRQALDQIAGELRAGHPTFVYTPHTIPQAVQDGGRIAWGSRAANVGRARELLAVPPPETNPEKPDETEAGEPSSLSYPCPCCGGRMLIIETFERGGVPRYRPTAPIAVIRIDTS